MGPGGLGDHIWLNGAVRYLANQYSEIHLLVSRFNVDTLKAMYSDLPYVKFVPVIWSIDNLRTHVKLNYRNVYACAFTKDLYKINFDMNDIPGVFYDQLGLPRSIRHSHFSLPSFPESMVLYNTVKSQPYIFVHTKSSELITEIVSWNVDSILTIDPNVNQYAPDHRWYGLANSYVNKPFFHYCDMIKHASELHLTNSSFYTLATQIPPLDAKVKHCYDRYSGKVMPHFDFS